MTDNPQPVTVVVADDQASVREGLVLMLGTLAGITWVRVPSALSGIAGSKTKSVKRPSQGVYCY